MNSMGTNYFKKYFFWVFVPFDTLIYLGNGKNLLNLLFVVLHKDNFIRNIKKRTSSRLDWLKNKCFTYKKTKNIFFNTNKQNKLLRGTSNEHSYQVWFQFKKWFSRWRLKCKNYRRLTSNNDNSSTWSFGSDELKIRIYLLQNSNEGDLI